MRTIEFLRTRHVPDLETCKADAPEGDNLTCGNAAVILVRVNGREAFVCHQHLTLLCKEKWPVKA